MAVQSPSPRQLTVPRSSLRHRELWANKSAKAAMSHRHQAESPPCPTCGGSDGPSTPPAHSGITPEGDATGADWQQIRTFADVDRKNSSGTMSLCNHLDPT